MLKIPNFILIICGFLSSVCSAQNNGIYVIDGYGMADSTNTQPIQLTLNNQDTLKAIQFSFQYDATSIQMINLVGINRVANFEITYNEPDSGEVNVIITKFDNTNILPGSEPIVEINFSSVGEDYSPVSELNLSNVVFSNSREVMVEAFSIDGYFFIQGDNYLRLTNGINNFSANVLSNFDVYGLQFNLRFDPLQINIDTIKISDEINNMTLSYNRISENQIRILIYDFSSSFIPSGVNELLTVDYQNLDSSISGIEVTGIILSNQLGESVDTEGFSANDGINYYVDEVISNFKITSNISKVYHLKQNYPNPFNSNTTIKYHLPKSENIKLTIFDVTGKEVKVLVNKYQLSGDHVYNLNAINFASGVYFYSIKTKSYSEFRKMILVK